MNEPMHPDAKAAIKTMLDGIHPDAEIDLSQLPEDAAEAVAEQMMQMETTQQQQESEAQQQEEERRQKLGEVLRKRRDDAVKYRRSTGVELRMAEDQAYYEGLDDNASSNFYKGMTLDAPLLRKPKNTYKSNIFLNITRPYVETAASKVVEVLCPSDERSFGIDPARVPARPPAPGPELMKADLTLQQAKDQQQPPQGQPQGAAGMAPPDPNAAAAAGVPPPPPVPGQEGQGAPAQPGIMNQQGPGGTPPSTQPQAAPAEEPPKDPMTEAIDAAYKSARAAQDWIDTQLMIGGFTAELRKGIEECARLGTFVLKGPTPVVRRQMSVCTDPETQETKVVIKESLDPESRCLSAWAVYPDPACGDDIHRGQYVIERDQMVERSVQDLIGQPGYIEEAIRSVIEAGPRSSVMDELARAPHESMDPTARSYDVWYYTGFLAKEDVLALNCTCTDDDVLANVGVPVVVTMINDTPVKAHINPLPSGRFPYDFVCWQKVAGSPFGIGVARQVRASQSILNANVRAVNENGGLCSGPQIILSRGAVVPADNSWEITPRKVWYLKPDADIADVTKAFNAFNIPSNQPELLQVIEFALKMAETSTGLPVLLQGQQGQDGVPETVGGMQILISNASSLLRRMARIIDDDLIVPHISRYVEWMMQYSDNKAAIGEFNIVPRGSTALVARDVRDTFLMQSVPQLMTNSAFGIDPTRYFKVIARRNGLDPAEVQFTPEELMKITAANQAAAQQQLDPRVQVAQIRSQTTVQTKGAELQTKEKIATDDNQVEAFKIQRDTDRDNAYVALETERTRVNSAAKMQELQLRKELAMLDYANTHSVTLEKIKAQLAIEGGRLDLQRELSTMPSPEEIGAQARGEAAHVAPQVEAAAVEPPGKAPPGQAFQQ